MQIKGRLACFCKRLSWARDWLIGPMGGKVDTQRAISIHDFSFCRVGVFISILLLRS